MAEWLMAAVLKSVAASSAIPRFLNRSEHFLQVLSEATWLGWAENTPFWPVAGTISGTADNRFARFFLRRSAVVLTRLRQGLTTAAEGLAPL